MAYKRFTKHISFRLGRREAEFFRQVADEQMTPRSRIARAVLLKYLQAELDKRRLRQVVLP